MYNVTSLPITQNKSGGLSPPGQEEDERCEIMKTANRFSDEKMRNAILSSTSLDKPFINLKCLLQPIVFKSE